MTSPGPESLFELRKGALRVRARIVGQQLRLDLDKESGSNGWVAVEEKWLPLGALEACSPLFVKLKAGLEMLSMLRTKRS